MSCENQCCAYMGNKRCINESEHSSDHCSLHRGKAKHLYLKYKSLSEDAKTIDLSIPFNSVVDQIDYLMECYCKFNNTFQARLKHKNYAYVPECYDEGHMHQLYLLNDKMSKCEKMLEELMEQLSNNEESEQSSEESIEDKEVGIVDSIARKNVSKINRKISNYKQWRLQQEAETNKLINYYIDENKVILQNRKRLTNLILAYIDKLYDEMNDTMGYFVRHMVTFNLVYFLYKFDYFYPFFKPDRCNDITCGCYIPYELKLACSCVMTNYPNVRSYFQKISEKSLTKYYELLLLNKKKLLPMMKDLMALYEEHEESLLFLKVHLVWHPDIKRLVVEPNTYEDLPKMSKVYAQSRLKNKYYHQKRQQEYLTGKLY